MTNCTLTGNVAGLSGGGAADSTLFNCTLTGNSTANSSGGGAVGCVLYNCTLSGNAAGTLQFSAGIGGGGAAGAVLFNCTVTNNWSYADGGGVSVTAAAEVRQLKCRLYNCTISGNSCRRGGGAFYGAAEQLRGDRQFGE